jgi:GNAT superfamily N-acetyltransferase
MIALTDKDINNIERATAQAVPAQRTVELKGWLVAMDNSTVGRAKSAVPLRHDLPDVGVIEQIETRYAQAGLPSAFRLPDIAAFKAFEDALRQRGYRQEQPTCVQVARINSIQAPTCSHRITVTDQPTPAWAEGFLGPGFDAADGASRIEVLSRSTCTRYASICADSQTLAAGALSISHGWASFHGMRTLATARKQGLASALLARFAQLAQAEGCERWFLQVEAANETARNLYAKLGFTTAWQYNYWRKA